MTCRIDRILVEADRVVLRISGRLTRADLDILRTALDQDDVSVMDLAEVDLVDREAVEFLVVGEANGVELRNCPAYIREWITRERGGRSRREQ